MHTSDRPKKPGSFPIPRHFHDFIRESGRLIHRWDKTSQQKQPCNHLSCHTQPVISTHVLPVCISFAASMYLTLL